MNISLHRLWVVVNTVSADVLYSSCQYSQAKNMHDYYQRKSNLPTALLRYDLSRSYFDELNRIIENDMQQALSNVVRFVAPRISTTQTKTKNK